MLLLEVGSFQSPHVEEAEVEAGSTGPDAVVEVQTAHDEEPPELVLELVDAKTGATAEEVVETREDDEEVQSFQ